MALRPLVLIVFGALLAAEEDAGQAVPALPPGHWQTVEATAYCPCARCCGTRTGRTSTGARTDASPYNIAADPEVIPYGRPVFIPLGLGYCDRVRGADRVFRVDDTGSALVAEGRGLGLPRIDLRFRDHGSALRFGRRRIQVYLFDPCPERNK